MVPYFGEYAELVHVLVLEIHRSIYKNCDGTHPHRFLERTPYFARVKIEKNAVLQIQAERYSRYICEPFDHQHSHGDSNTAVEKNQFVKKELEVMYRHLEATLYLWDFEIMRSTFRAWFDVSVVRKRVLEKKLHWFSVWFSQSVRALLVD